MKFRSLVFLACLCISGPALAGTKPGQPAAPVYRPPEVTSTVRVWGLAALAGLVERWEDKYRLAHPEVNLEIHMTGSDVAMAGLYTGQADLALLGRPVKAAESQAFEWVYQYPPTAQKVLNGSFRRPGRCAALEVLVHRDNPLESISYNQLRALFNRSSQDRAGWIDHWGKLGLGGDWTRQAVHLYGPDMTQGTGRFFRANVLQGSRLLNWGSLREFAVPADAWPDSSVKVNRSMLNALSRDPLGLAVGVMDPSVTTVKPLAISACDGCPTQRVSPAAIVNGSYPLTRAVYAVFNQPPGQPPDSVLSGFLEYVTGAGQSQLTSEDGFLPLRAQP